MTKCTKTYYITKWAVIGMWRLLMGRWFVLRDAPIAVIRFWSIFGHSLSDESQSDENKQLANRFWQEARQESISRQYKNR